MQGEGQEFESPRLHHLGLVRTLPGSVDPLFRVLPMGGHRPADRWRASSNRVLEVLTDRTLPTGYVNRLEREVFCLRFRRVVKETIPIPNSRWPLGQRLEGVKLHRARGGCLGAKSRRRTRQAAKSSGESRADVISGDIRMGKPGWRNPVTPG